MVFGKRTGNVEARVCSTAAGAWIEQGAFFKHLRELVGTRACFWNAIYEKLTMFILSQAFMALWSSFSA